MKYPKFLDITVEGEQVTASMKMPNDLDWCQGHFESIAIVPGVAQLSFVAELLRRAINFDIEELATSIDNMKFVKPMLVGDTVLFTVKRDLEKQVVTFKITDINDFKMVYSSGKIQY